MKEELCTRRRFIKQLTWVGSALLGTGLAAGAACSSEESRDQSRQTNQSTVDVINPCDDVSSLNRDELKRRKEVGYVKETPIAENRCDNCSLYIPPDEKEECGRCNLFDGPVRAEGYCPYWTS